MMLYEIPHCHGGVCQTVTIPDDTPQDVRVKRAVEQAVKLGANLRLAYLRDANLRGADLRDDSHAQYEAQQYGRALRQLIEPIVPTALAAFDEQRGEQ